MEGRTASRDISCSSGGPDLVSHPQFTIRLSAVEPPEEPGESVAYSEPSSPGGTILLMEDEGDVRTVVRRILEKGDYEVIEPELPVLFMSGYAEEEAADKVGKLDATILSKPFPPDALLEAVARALSASRRRGSSNRPSATRTGAFVPTGGGRGAATGTPGTGRWLHPGARKCESETP